MADAAVQVLETGIRIRDLVVRGKDVADFLRSTHAEQRESTLVQAIEVGVFCLERARNTQDIEFVRRQIEQLVNQVERAVSEIPRKTQAALVEKLGTGNGQVLAPVANMVKEASQAASAKLSDVRSLLVQDLDPSKETTTLGRALRRLRDLLDPQRSDSVQASVEKAVKSITSENGLLAGVVKSVVGEAIKPLEAEVKDLAKEVRGQEAAAEAVEQTTQKGFPYEEQVVAELQYWARIAGAEVFHVGGDNQPGDVVIKLAPNSLAPAPLTIVVEVRDRQTAVGRKAITDVLTKAMVQRDANCGIYISRTPEGFGKEVGDWAEGTSERGGFVACTHPHLLTAVRFLNVQKRLEALRLMAPEMDSSCIEAQVQRIRTALDRVKSINRKVTEIRGGAQGIQDEAELLRNEIRAALAELEEAIRGRNSAPTADAA